MIIGPSHTTSHLNRNNQYLFYRHLVVHFYYLYHDVKSSQSRDEVRPVDIVSTMSTGHPTLNAAGGLFSVPGILTLEKSTFTPPPPISRAYKPDMIDREPDLALVLTKAKKFSLRGLFILTNRTL